MGHNRIYGCRMWELLLHLCDMGLELAWWCSCCKSKAKRDTCKIITVIPLCLPFVLLGAFLFVCSVVIGLIADGFVFLAWVITLGGCFYFCGSPFRVRAIGQATSG